MFISVKDKKEVENLLQNIFCINMGMGVKSIQYLPSTRSLSRFYERSKNRTQKKNIPTTNNEKLQTKFRGMEILCCCQKFIIWSSNGHISHTYL